MANCPPPLLAAFLPFQAAAVVNALYTSNVPQTLLQLLTTLPQQVRGILEGGGRAELKQFAPG